MGQQLSYSSPVRVDKANIIATPEFQQEKANIKKKKTLVIVMQNDALITAYWCKYPEYLKRTEPKTFLQIL